MRANGRAVWFVAGVALGYVLVAFARNEGDGGPGLSPRDHEAGQPALPGTDPVDASPRTRIEEPEARGSSEVVSPVESVRAVSAQLLPDRVLTARELLQKPFVDVAAMDLPREVVMDALVAAGAASPQNAEQMWTNMVRGVAYLRWETQQLAEQRRPSDAGKDARARADLELRRLASGLVRDLPTLIRDGKAATTGTTRGPAVPPKRVLGASGCGLVASDRLRFEFVDPPCSLYIEISIDDLSVTQRSTVHAIAGELLPGGRPAK